MSVLDELVDTARQRSVGLRPKPENKPVRPSFREAIAGRDQVSIIAEFKRCSPSEGPISPEADVFAQAERYIAGGARAMSILTEPTHFGGSYEDLQRVTTTLDIPVIMKDFVVTHEQVQLAAELGASAVLLIVRCLTPEELRDLMRTASDCGIDTLVECHDPEEIQVALNAGAEIIGCNHRNLATLAIDFENGKSMLDLIPSDRISVSESGIATPSDVHGLRGRTDAALIGTTLMRAPDPVQFLTEALA